MLAHLCWEHLKPPMGVGIVRFWYYSNTFLKYAHKSVTTVRTIENDNTSHSQILELGASS
eukprot:1155183-Pelagomonas_calceolata.AAC.1